MRHVLAVTLKSPDPAAITALGALAGFMPGSAPVRILRYEVWEFEAECDRDSIVRTVDRYPDILNPNKQRGAFLDAELPPVAGDGQWVFPPLGWRRFSGTSGGVLLKPASSPRFAELRPQRSLN